MRTKQLIHSISIASLVAVSGPAAAYQAQPAAPQEETYVYYYDELASSRLIPPALRTLRRRPAEAALFSPCAAGEAQTAAVLVPVFMGLFKIFGNIIDARAREREKRNLERMSRSYAGLRNDASFPLVPAGAADPAFRCLVVDRVAQVGNDLQSRSVYVLGLRQLSGSTNAFTVEPIAARIDSSPLLVRSDTRVNATVTVAFQSVVAGQGANQLSTLPAFTASFRNLAAGSVGRPSPSDQRTSPVLPIVQRGAATSTVVAVTEADVRLASETQRVALEQTNRTTLLSALGDILKAAITD